MGGFGSGNWSDPSSRKTCAEECLILSARNLRLSGFFADGKCGEVVWKNGAGEIVDKVAIEMQGDRLKIGDQIIQLERTRCNYGGWRWWFLCPIVKDGVLCNGRAGKLYLPPSGKFFGCRHCHDLTYRSCQESHKYDKVFGHLDNLDVDKLSVAQILRLGELLK